MEKGEVSFLNQLVKSLEESEPKLKRAYEEGDSEEFNSVKSFILKLQKQIEETIKSMEAKK